MKRGTNDIVNPMRGSVPIQKVMRGSTLVWERNTIPRIYGVAESIGSRIEFSDDLGVTWDTSILNPESVGEATVISLSTDGQIIAIGHSAAGAVISTDGGSSFAKITSPVQSDSRYLNVSGDGSTIYITDINTDNNIWSQNYGSSFAVMTPFPPSNRMRYNQINNDGSRIYGLRPGQTPYYYFNGSIWTTIDNGELLQGMAVARNESKLYAGTQGSTITILDPPNGPPSGVLYGLTSDQLVVCSGDGSHVLVSDGNTLEVWLSTTFGTSPVNITSRIAFVTTASVVLRNSTIISYNGQYMVIPDIGCIHVSSDYGATFTKRSLFFGSSNYSCAVTG